MSSSKSRNSNSSDFLNDECDDESFLLDWNNHTFSMTSSLSLIRERQDFVDVTIVAGQNDTSNDDEDDEQDEDIESRHCRSFGAHKVILSACSPYLRRLLRGLSSWQHPVLVFREIPADDLEAILTFVYVGKVQISRQKLNSFLKSAEILNIKGLSHIQNKRSRLKSSTEQNVERVNIANDDIDGPDDDELSRRLLDRSSESTCPKRPRLIQRPPPKPVTTTITPALLKAHRLSTNTAASNVVVKSESCDVADENFVDANVASTSARITSASRNFRENLLSEAEHLIVPSLALDSNSLGDISSSAQEASAGSDSLSERAVGKSSLCPLCRAVLSNANALSYHMNYLHGIDTDPQFFNSSAPIVKEDLS